MRRERQSGAFIEHGAQRDGSFDAISGDEFLDPARCPVDHDTFGETQQIAELRDDHRAQLRSAGYLLHDMSEVRQHHDAGGAGILELMLQLARRVQRIGIDDREART